MAATGGAGELDDYLMAGRIKCLKSTAGRPKQDTLFVVGRLGKSAICGWSYKTDGEVGEHFRYISDDGGTVGFKTIAQLGRSLLESKRVDLSYVAAQRNQYGSQSQKARFDGIQLAAFDDIPFAVFFSSSYVGIYPDDVMALRNSGGGTSVTQHGVLSLACQNNEIQSITFSQQQDDVLTARVDGKKLRDATNAFFLTGMAKTHCEYRFDPPWSPQVSAPWTTTSTVERLGLGGEKYQAKYRTTVEFFTKDPLRIEGEMSKILSLIPENEEVQSNSPIDYVWKDQSISRRIDGVALNKAGDLHFDIPPRRNRAYVFGGVAISCLVSGLWFSLRRLS